jgi:hypothetical protein
VRKEIFLALRRIKREEKQRGYEEGIYSGKNRKFTL